jgi:hypothetical protein
MNNKLVANVQKCIETRQIALEVTCEVLDGFRQGSEVDFHNSLKQALAARPELMHEGWYSPPPAGIGILFAKASDTSRSKYTTFRDEPYWAKPEYTLSDETVGMIYMSPVDKQSGMIGDLGFSFYRGKDQRIRDHLVNTLMALEEVVEHTKVGLEFREVARFANTTFQKAALDSRVVTQVASVGINVGHTIPWSHEAQTKDEMNTLQTGTTHEINELIRHKRRMVDEAESFVVPETIAFTIETRVVSAKHSELPNVHFHFIVVFQNGKKQVLSGFNQIFDTLGMNYIRSKY